MRRDQQVAAAPENAHRLGSSTPPHARCTPAAAKRRAASASKAAAERKRRRTQPAATTSGEYWIRYTTCPVCAALVLAGSPEVPPFRVGARAAAECSSDGEETRAFYHAVWPFTIIKVRAH